MRTLWAWSKMSTSHLPNASKINEVIRHWWVAKKAFFTTNSYLYNIDWHIPKSPREWTPFLTKLHQYGSVFGQPIANLFANKNIAQCSPWWLRSFIQYGTLGCSTSSCLWGCWCSCKMERLPEWWHQSALAPDGTEVWLWGQLLVSHGQCLMARFQAGVSFVIFFTVSHLNLCAVIAQGHIGYNYYFSHL